MDFNTAGRIENAVEEKIYNETDTIISVCSGAPRRLG